MSWKEYYEKTKSLPPRPLLINVLEQIEKDDGVRDKVAIDLGCGAGQDTRELLSRGWKVTSIDSSADSISSLRETVSSEKHTCLQKSFDEIRSLKPAYLVYASLSLPFCSREGFSLFWKVILSALEPEGWLAADFFGPNDDWVKSNKVTGHSMKELQEMLGSCEVVDLKERSRMGRTQMGEEKFWHIFSVIAKKRISHD